MRAVFLFSALLFSSCAASSDAGSSADPISPITAPATSDVNGVPPEPASNPVTATQPIVLEVMKDCPLRALTAIEAIVGIESTKQQFSQVNPPIGQSVVSSVRVVEVLWQRPHTDLAAGVTFDGLVYAHSTTPEQWGFDGQWLMGDDLLITGLSANQIRDVDVNWEFQSVLVETDGTLRFPVECFDRRFAELSTRTERSGDLDLYLDLLVEDQEFRDCQQNQAGEACVPGPVLAAAQQIDDELPGQ